MSNQHPLEKVFHDCIQQIAEGKGTRHGGDTKKFMDQPWKQITDDCGIGFLGGQAVKKASEGFRRFKAGVISEVDFEREILGAINYLAMSILYVSSTEKVDSFKYESLFKTHLGGK
jgi:hypothetical protein